MKPCAALGLSRRAATRPSPSRPASASTRCRKSLRIVAFKEQDDIKDWRVKQMVDICHAYYSSLWSRGDMGVADMLLDPQFVYRDLCSVAAWAPQPASAALPATGMVVGPRAFKGLIDDVRTQYPDLYVEVEDLAVSDTHRIFVSWISHGTQLETPPANGLPADRKHEPLPSPAAPFPTVPPHPSRKSPLTAATNAAPSYHNSLVRGVDVITFSPDRSRMQEVNVFRQLNSDERRDVERRLAPNPLEIRLARLHWDQPRQQQPQQLPQQQQQRGKPTVGPHR